MITEFYKDCEIFMTGGSGVVGKAAIEKLLRSCDVKRIYILLRPKKNQSVEQRLVKIKQSKIFRQLRLQKPTELDKLACIPGDAMLPILGITSQSAKVLENVSIFFHCAATVRFDESMKFAMKLNVGGTLEALKFAETLKNLKLFMHVSTFFSNPYLETIEPKLYPSPVDWKFFLDVVQDESKQYLLNALTKKLITGFPNTYCFTKNLAESVVNDFRDRLPVAIFRPSIVIFALDEPEPGYPPAFMGAMGLFVLVGCGILKTVYMKKNIRLDVTPLDMGTIVMLASTVLASKQIEKSEVDGQSSDIPISICSSCGISPHTFKEMGSCPQKYGIWDKFVYEKNFLLPWCYFTEYRILYMTICFMYQVLPAMLGDGLLRLFGREPVLMGIVRRAYNSLEIMQPFLFNNYECEAISHNKALLEITNGTDFSLLSGIKKAGSDEGLRNNCTNMTQKIREVLLNEDPATVDRAKKVLMTKKVFYNVVRIILVYYVLRWFYRILSNYI